jgi:hypothetical protein
MCCPPRQPKNGLDHPSRHMLRQVVLVAVMEIERTKKPSRRSVVLTREEGTKVLTPFWQKRLPTSYSDLKHDINHRSGYQMVVCRTPFCRRRHYASMPMGHI